MIRVPLVDDQPLIRGGFRALLDADDDLEVVAEAGDGHEGVALARQHLPDVALLDVRMPRVDSIEATRRITADPKTAMMTIASRSSTTARVSSNVRMACGRHRPITASTARANAMSVAVGIAQPLPDRSRD